MQQISLIHIIYLDVPKLVSFAAAIIDGMAMMQPEQLRQLLAQLSSNGHLRIEFSDVVVQGPAIQVLPLMVFV